MRSEITFVVQILSEMIDPGNWTDETIEMDDILIAMKTLKDYRAANPKRTFRLIQIQRTEIKV